MSKRIARLTDDLRHGDQSEVLDEFWQGVAATGTPLVEPADDPNYRLVTFVWRDQDHEVENVVVLWGPAPYWDVPANMLSRVPGTDVWHKTYRVRSDMRGRYILSPNDPLTPLPQEGTVQSWQRYSRFQPDPLNPRVLRIPRNSLDQYSTERRFSVFELPDAPPQPWARPREGSPTGTLHHHQIGSSVLGNNRPVWVHTPAGYTPTAGQLPLLVLLDGRSWIEQLPVTPTLDNLLADGRIPPLITVLVDSLDWETRSKELTCHEPFLEFLTDELVPWVGEHWSVTDAPAQRIIDGFSYGGLAALFAGLRRPDVFGTVIAHSPSLWWKAGTPFDQHSEWLTRRFALAPRQPLRIYLEMGLNEGPFMVPTARQLRDVLEAKRYDLTYVEYNGGHDLNCWRGGLGDALSGLHLGQDGNGA